MKVCSIFFVLAILLTGCGYKPSSYYAKSEIVGKVFVESKINIESSENSIIIKDTVNNMIINEFNGSLVDKQNKADTIVLVNLVSTRSDAISTDDEGYTKAYRMTVTIDFKYKKLSSMKSYKMIRVSDYYDYSVLYDSFGEVDSVSTQRKKEEAEKLASKNALLNIFSKIAVNSFQK